MTQIPKDFVDKSVCVLGLGYVGLTLATTMAEAGFRVLGVEIREDVTANLRLGVPHFNEPGLSDRLKRVVEDGRLRVISAIPAGCDASAFIITVGTPLDEAGDVRLDMIQHASREVSRAIEDGALVILRSTVKVGTTHQVVRPILEKSGKQFELAFCPERTLEGRAMTELRELPQIVGADSHETTVRAAQLFQMITPTVVRVADTETAEVIKLVDNVQRDVLFGLANEVARACDALGVSASEVIAAGKLGYPRANLPVPGPVGGPCLEKDPYIYAESLSHLGVEPELALSARRLNERQPAEVVQWIASSSEEIDGFTPTPTITLLGIAFKGRPPTDDIRGTMARPVLASLREHFPDARFRGHDPEVRPEVIGSLGLEPMADLEAAMRDSHLLVIMTSHPAYADMPLQQLSELLARPSLIYDFWDQHSAHDLQLPLQVGYASLGSHGRAVLPWASS